MENEMDAVLALGVERGLMNDVVFNDEKKMKKDGSSHAHSHHQSSEKKQKNNDVGGGGSNGKDKKMMKKKFEQLEFVTVVMKVDFHCDGCRRRIFETARSFRGTYICAFLNYLGHPIDGFVLVRSVIVCRSGVCED